MISKKTIFYFLLVFFFGSSLFAARDSAKLPPKTTKVAKEAKAKSTVVKKRPVDYIESLSNEIVEGDEEAGIALKVSQSSSDEAAIPVTLPKSEVAKEAKISPFHKMLAALSTLLLFALVVFFFIHKSAKKGSLASGARNIKILSQKPIGPKRNLMVIKVAGESILLGVTDQNINFIKNLSILDDEMPEIAPEGFSQQLQGHLKSSPAREAAAPSSAPLADPGDAIDGYAVSKLADVQDVITRRFR